MRTRLVLLASMPEVDQRHLCLPGGREIEPVPDPARGLFGGEVTDARWHGSDPASAATAGQLGFATAPAPLLRARELGAWAGRSLVELADEVPAEVARLQADLEFAPPGGESLAEVIDRVGAWFDDAAAAGGGRSLVVVSPEVVRAAVAVALDAPVAMVRLDVVALSRTVLTHDGSAWRVRTVASTARSDDQTDTGSGVHSVDGSAS